MSRSRVGASATFHVGIAATTDVTRVELWQNGTIADIYEPTGDRLDLRPSLDWMPTSAGTYLITARATDADGRTGMSNPLWVDVTDTPDLTVLDADDTSSPGNAQPTAFAGTAMRSIAPFRQPFMIQTGSATQPSLSISDIRCGARLSAVPATSGVPSRLVLMTIPPGGRTMSPVAELEPNADGRADLTAALPTGTQAFVLAEMSDGLVIGWSPPVIANVGVGCATPGWSGELALVGGRLQAQTDVTTAYMYLQTDSDTWTRVPAVGSVPRSASGFDFSSELPPLSGSYTVRAWGWSGGSLKYVGAGTYTPPGGSASSATPTDAVALGGAPYLPAPTLRWIERPAARNVPEVLSTHGVIDVDPDDHLFGVERFRWDAPYNGVTHAVVQVSGSPIPLKDGPTAGLGLFTCIVSGSGGEFQIDFDHDTCITGDRQSVTPVSATKGSYNAIVMPGVGLPFGQSPVSEVDPVSQLENDIYGDPESPSYDTIDWIEQRTVRVLPMTTDSWNGSVSNDVTFEIDRTPKAPPGEYAYDIDLRLVQAPRAPDFEYANCWQFVGWKNPGAAAAHAKAELNGLLAKKSLGLVALPTSTGQPYYFWTQVTKAFSPLCAGCRSVSFAGWGSATVGLGGADCSSSSSFWEDPVGWVISNVGGPIVAVIKEFVNLVSNGFAYLKSLAVEGLMELTGCTGKWCKTIAEAVVTAR